MHWYGRDSVEGEVNALGILTEAPYADSIQLSEVHKPVVHWYGGDGVEGKVNALGGAQSVIVATAMSNTTS